MILFLLARSKGFCPGAAAPIASLRSLPRLKNSPPDCFFYGLFESLRKYTRIKKQNHSLRNDSIFIGPLEGIRTPVLQNRNLLRYPAAPRAEILIFSYSFGKHFVS